MNGIPIKLDYSKTINEQLGTFNYYRNRYACYELELMRDRQQIDQLTNNWNELEEWIKNENSNYVPLDSYVDGTNATYEEILDKMKEIKEGNNDRSRRSIPR